MPKVEGVAKLLRAFRRAAGQHPGRVSCRVGYTAKTALWVHEKRAMAWRGRPRKSGIGVYWGPQGRAGFLLDVAREEADRLRSIFTTAMQRGAELGKALLLAGLHLQRVSMQNVPVEHGILRASAFSDLDYQI